MAEFDAEAASLGLFQEFFSHLSAKSADDVVGSGSSVVAPGTDTVCKNGFGGMNRVDDSSIKQHSFSKTLIQSLLIHNKTENGVSTQKEHANNNNTADLMVDHDHGDDDSDDDDANVKPQKCVLLDDVNKRTLAEASNSDVVEGGGNIPAESVACDNIADVSESVHINLNGTASTVQMPNGRQKKGVNFPKDSIISSYLEPPDPWKNACSWTTSELVSAYKKSCEINGAKPIAKLIQQLQTFSPSNSREEVLSLKGEKLDQKQCECLEEILKRVRFKLLDFEASHLDDETAVTLFDMIEFYESSYQLNIAFNKSIQARGWQACSRLVRRTPDLNYLDLRNCDLNERTIPIFGRALKLGCHLTILHMENMNLSGRPLIILVAALKMNETLQELFLADNKLLPTDGIQLGNLLHYNHKLALLDLRNNHLQDVGTSHICEGLTEQNKGSGLRTLVLWNNSINYQAMSVLGRALASSQNMETLNIGHNAITNEGVHLLKDGLIRVSSLLRLGLQGTRISDEGAVALAEYIAESMVLLRIDLRDNDIKTGGLMALSHAMRVNTSVTRIDLDKDPKKDPGIKDYVEQQTRLLRDILTFQQRNVQLALQKEEEKSRLTVKAVAELATARKEAENEHQFGHLPANSSTESFTLIDAVPVEDSELETDNQNSENTSTVITGKGHNEDNAASKTCTDIDQLDYSPRKEEGKIQQRPTVLFPFHMLPPQATLDSPLPVYGFNHNISDTTADFEPCSESMIPVLDVSPAPAEIILSPQYFPKQIARKIFSVSRVSENASCQQLSSSPTSSMAFDPLCVSPLSLIPPPSAPVLLPPAVPVLQCVERVSQHSKVNLLVDSPSASLFQHLADETVKHMVSPDTDVDVNSLLGNDAQSCGVKTEIKDTKGDDELIIDLPVENYPPSAVLKSFCTELASLLHAEQSCEMVTEPNDDVNACDNDESSASDAATKQAIVSSTDSDKENLVITGCSISKQDISLLEDSSKELLTLDGVTENIQDIASTAFTSQEFDLHQACTVESQDTAIENNCETHIDHCSLEVSIEDPLKDLRKAESLAENLLESEEASVNLGQLSGLANTSPFVFVDNAKVTDMKLNEVKNSSNIVNSKTGHQQNHVAPSVNVHSFEHLEQTHSLSALADMNTQEELMAVRLINFSNPSLHSSDNIEELLFPVLPDLYVSNQSDIDNSEVLSLKGVQKVETGNRMKHIAPPLLSAKTQSDQLRSDSLADQPIVDNVVSDNVDIINVDFGMDEEPWLSVGVDVEANDSEASKKSKQPDFFTTLSMNGLAQELASALTSFDGSSGPFEVEEYSTGS